MVDLGVAKTQIMQKNYAQLLLLVCSFFFLNTTFGQEKRALIQESLKKESQNYNYAERDIKDWTIVDQHKSEKHNITYTYINQTYNQLKVHNAIGVFALKDDKATLTAISFISNLSSKVQSSSAGITPETAISNAAQKVGIRELGTISKTNEKDGVMKYSAPAISKEQISVELKLFVVDSNNVKAVWDLDIYTLDQKHWWSFRVDAQNGQILDQNDWVVECTANHNKKGMQHDSHCQTSLAMAPPPTSANYNVFPIPEESPNHGPRQILPDPSDINASPQGWHDNDGNPGSEFTDTRGNNVWASEDRNDNGGFGYAPDGGATLNFDFPLNLNQDPINYEDVAITNLFYMNNIMHDVWYQYGFDEGSGNFQDNNYGNGGAGGDYVEAEAQDGGGLNNANFATPPDGNNPRMQMYLWSAPAPNLLTVNAPSTVSGPYNAEEAAFGPGVPATPITADIVIYDDNTPDEMDACEPAVNGAALNGKIALIRRGTCQFVNKVVNAENEGAVAVIVINNVGGGPIVMGGTDPGIGIPSVMISDIDGANLIAEIQGGATVNATLQNSGTTYQLDGDLDNGIIAHEYGHGISNRLTGGASNSNCLSNAEQMGEGWSDWFALMLTIEPGDAGADVRGIGTYATGETPTGNGIRPAPYSTDFGVNSYTYAATNNTGQISQPHGIGFVWSTMLWDLTWALIDQYGYDPDIYNGTGGNNIAMHLVINGIKLQPCGPGFVDGRDAILQADQLLYGGQHQCLIWNVFANRGLGYSADQGSANSRTDQTEAFDLPPGLTNTSGSESVTACESYTWSANGQTYTSSGSYTANLTNSFGCDSTATLNLTINPTYDFNESITECGNYVWPVNGQTYTSTGTYTETFTATNGCDSTYTLNLTIQSAYNISEDITVCDQYTWSANGQTYTSSGSYTETLVSTNGCDSIVTLNLTVNPALSSTETITVCDQYTWSANGQTYTSSGNYSELLTSVDGCDSTANLDLTIVGSYNTNETVTECNSYTWPTNGQTYTTSGSYTETLTSSSGCDSIATLNLTIQSPAPGSINEVACQSYTWADNGQTYTNSGAYTTTLTTAGGCDSTVTLYLTINNPAAGFENVTTCSSYTWPTNGQTYSSSGSYTSVLTAANGCDSTAILNLTITQPTSSLTTATSCGSYTWNANGQTYNSSGTYNTVFTGSNGCDSTVFLNLTITQPTSGSESVNSCDSYTWPTNGQTYNTSGSYITVIQGNNGCDSTVTLNLTINDSNGSSETASSCDTYTWAANNQTYNSTGIYTAVLQNNNGCDSTVTLDLTINTINSQVVLGSDNISLEAQTGYDSYQWVNCDRHYAPIPDATSPTYAPAENGSYAVIITNGNCTDTSECEQVYSLGITKNEFTNLSIYPNPTSGNVTVDFGQNIEDATIRLFDVSGKAIESRIINNKEQITMSIPGTRGIYIIEIRTSSGTIERRRISKMF